MRENLISVSESCIRLSRLQERGCATTILRRMQKRDTLADRYSSVIVSRHEAFAVGVFFCCICLTSQLRFLHVCWKIITLMALTSNRLTIHSDPDEFHSSMTSFAISASRALWKNIFFETPLLLANLHASKFHPWLPRICIFCLVRLVETDLTSI